MCKETYTTTVSIEINASCGDEAHRLVEHLCELVQDIAPRLGKSKVESAYPIFTKKLKINKIKNHKIL